MEAGAPGGTLVLVPLPAAAVGQQGATRPGNATAPFLKMEEEIALGTPSGQEPEACASWWNVTKIRRPRVK